MQKKIKIKKNKKFYFSKLKKKIKRYYWRKKLRLRLKKTKKTKFFFYIKKKNQLNLFQNKKYNRQITIKITGNNIFCSVCQLKKGKVFKTLLITSAGLLKIKMSKKLLKRYALDRVLKLFRFRARKFLNAGGIIFVLTIPIKIRKRIIKSLTFFRKYKIKTLFNKKLIETRGYRAILIKILDKKIFNGCQMKKRKRKKKNFSRLKR